MQKDKSLSVTIFCLSISIIISGMMISNGLKYVNNGITSALLQSSSNMNGIVQAMNGQYQNVVYGRNTYDLQTSSTYLGISEDKLMYLVNSKNSRLPYIKVGKDYVFSKNALDKWLETARIEIK